ncbi:MAG: site-specific integrase [Maricaulaceae bacterium]|jgi:integrase
MARRIRLTKTIIGHLKYDGDGSSACIYWDETTPGFGVRVYPTGRKSFVIRYSVNGRRRTMALGAFGVLTLDEARKLALSKKSDVVQDPIEDRRETRRRGVTVNELAARYLDEHAFPKKKPRSAAEDKRNLEKYVLPAIGSRCVSDVSISDVASIHHRLRHIPGAANRVLSVMSKMFNLAEHWALRTPLSNPCRAVQKFKEHARNRALSPEEMSRLGRVLDRAVDDGLAMQSAADAIRFLLLTGCRRGEALSLTWVMIDFDLAVAMLPDSKTGPRPLVLPRPAIDLLKRRQRATNSPFAFAGADGEKALVNLKTAWRRITAAAELEDVRIHDLRHTFASVGVNNGEGLPLVGAVLGHRSPQTTQRYAHVAPAPVVGTANLISERIDALLSASQ